MLETIIDLLKKGSLKAEKIYLDKIEQNRCLEKLFFFTFLVLIGLMIYQLNHRTPWVVDDILKGDGIKNLHSIEQLLERLWGFYFGWGGRVWGEFFALLFLKLPKEIFNYVNSAGYMLFVLLIYLNMTGKTKISPLLLVLTNFLLFACLPAFGQDVLWISGCANYMWSSLIPLFYLMIMRFYYDTPNERYNSVFFLIVYFLVGLFSGWSNENVSVALLVMAVGYMYFYRDKYGHVPVFSRVGIVGVALGSALLWLAPGNFARFAAEGHSKSLGHVVSEMYKNATALFSYESTAILIIAFVALMILAQGRNKKLSLMFMAGAFLSSIAFGIVGHIHTRVFLGVVMLMCISVGVLFDGWEGNTQIRKFRFMLTLILVMSSVAFYSTALEGINDYDRRWKQNLEIIQVEKENGNLDVYVNPIAPKNKFCAAYGLDDIKPKKENQYWLNKGVAHAYGLKSIQSIRVDDMKK